MKTSLIVISIFLSLNFFAQKADTILVEPGSKYVDGSFIENYTNKWQVSFIDMDGNKTPIRIWTDYGEIIELKGSKYLHRVQDIYTSDLIHIDTWINMVEHNTLKPWQFYTTNSSGKNSFYKFSDNELIINSNINKDKTQKLDSINIKKPIFDWNLYGILFGRSSIQKRCYL